ncbi:MAG: DNA replication protein [Pseudomonadota bacterium]|nr:DNA replication protein [Pseudomonadota bacterium]
MTRPPQLAFDFGAPDRYDADQFLAGDSNAGALAWIARWPDWPGPALAIRGPEGAGKTHLVHIWAGRSDGTIVGGEDLDTAIVPDLAGRPVAVDDADRVADPRALLHLYNLQRESAAHLLLTGRAPVQDWARGLADLSSRLATAPLVQIDAPDDALLAALVVRHAAARQVHITPEAVRFLVARIERTFDAAARIVAALDRASLGTGRRITVPLARALLEPDGADGES